MFSPSTSNQVSKDYAMALLSHSWSRNKVQIVHRSNGTFKYDTYHLTTVM